VIPQIYWSCTSCSCLYCGYCLSGANSRKPKNSFLILFLWIKILFSLLQKSEEAIHRYHMVNCFHDQSIHFSISTQRIILLAVRLRVKISPDYHRIFSPLEFRWLVYQKIIVILTQPFNHLVVSDLIS
jgi:hypothetical protein